MFLSVAAACGKIDDNKPVDGGGDNTTPPVEELVPPQQVNESNLFIADFFSTLENDASYFSARSTDIAVQHINGASGKRPLVYMFDRTDYEVGKSNPMNDIAYKTASWQLFAQNQPTNQGVIEGTGMITKYVISDYDGIASNGTYMSGTMIPAPLSASTPIFFYTARISSVDQIKEIHKQRGSALLGDAVVIATVDNKVKGEVMNLVTNNMSMRAECLASEATALDVLVIVPMSYVCRSIQEMKTGNLPYYRVSIEKWM